MNIKNLRDYLNTLPEEVDNFTVVFSKVQVIDPTEKTWSKTDTLLDSAMVNEDMEELILGTSETIDNIIKLTAEENG